MKNAKLVQLLAMVMASSTLGAKGLACIGSCVDSTQDRVVHLLPPSGGEDGGIAPSETHEMLCNRHCQGANSCKESTLKQTDGTTIPTLECEWHFVCGAGRRPAGLVNAENCSALPLASWFAQAAHLEAASVTAFRLLRRDLRIHGAPRSLLRQASRAAREEKRHARRMKSLAKRAGIASPAPVVASLPIPSLEELARHNAVEGCIRETFGALVAGHQSAHTPDREFAAVMRRIAREETFHAAFSHRVDTWARRRLGRAAQHRIDEQRLLAAHELLREAAADVDSATRKALGLPDPCGSSILARNLLEVLRVL